MPAYPQIYINLRATEKLTPGGVLANATKSLIHEASECKLIVKPFRIILTFDSFAVLPGKDTERNRIPKTAGLFLFFREVTNRTEHKIVILTHYTQWTRNDNIMCSFR